MGVQIQGDTGNVIATKGTYSGNVTIGGTLTYEDVTNIDSVGLVTAREGIEVGARPGVAASISVDGNVIFSGITTIGGNVKVGTGVTLSPDGDVFATGVCTATSFSGDGTNLTNVGVDTAVVFTDKISLGDGGSSDGDQICVGVGSDLKIYHANGNTSSYVSHENGSGYLFLEGDAIQLRTRSATNNDIYVSCSQGGPVALYHNDNKRLETKSTGIEIYAEEAIIKLYDESNAVNTRKAIANDLGNTASASFTVPSCHGGGTVTVVGLSNGDHTTSTTKQYAIQINGTGTATLSSPQFTIDGSGGSWGYSVSATNQGVSVTNNGGAFGRFRVTFDITAYE